MARGVIIGVAWTAAFGEDVAIVVATENIARAPAAPAAANWKESCKGFCKLSARNAASFSGFLGAFSMASCTLEKIRRRDDFVNKLFGGVAAGAVAAISTGSPKQIALSAAYTGGISGFIFFLFSPTRSMDEID